MARKHFPHYWPFVRGIHQSPVDSWWYEMPWHSCEVTVMYCGTKSREMIVISFKNETYQPKGNEDEQRFPNNHHTTGIKKSENKICKEMGLKSSFPDVWVTWGWFHHQFLHLYNSNLMEISFCSHLGWNEVFTNILHREMCFQAMCKTLLRLDEYKLYYKLSFFTAKLFPIKFEIQAKKCSWNGPQSHFYFCFERRQDFTHQRVSARNT